MLDHIEDELTKYENSATTSMEKENKIVDFEKYKKEMDRLTNAYIKGRIDESYYDDEYARLKALIDEATSEESEYPKKISTLSKSSSVRIGKVHICCLTGKTEKPFGRVL